MELLGITTVTGLVLARIARPTARVMFSRVAFVQQPKGHRYTRFHDAEAL